MQVYEADFTESFLPVASDTSTSILIVMTLYHEEDGWITELCDVEAALMNRNMEVEMYIEWHEGIVDLVIITKGFLEEYCILLGKSMYGNVYTALLWIRLFANYFVN